MSVRFAASPMTRRVALRIGLFALSLIPFTANAASLKEIQARGYMTVATEDDYAPFEFVEAGKPKGFHHDIVAELKKYAKFEIRQEILPWTGLLAAGFGVHGLWLVWIQWLNPALPDHQLRAVKASDSGSSVALWRTSRDA
jgi:hypothetical protein